MTDMLFSCFLEKNCGSLELLMLLDLVDQCALACVNTFKGTG